jgi:chloride channel 3/4/5
LLIVFSSQANIWWTKHIRNGTFLKTHPIVEVAIITLVTVCVSFYNPWTKMGGTELVFEMFSGAFPVLLKERREVERS